MIKFSKAEMRENFLNLINQFLKHVITSYLSEIISFLSLKLEMGKMCLLRLLLLNDIKLVLSFICLETLVCVYVYIPIRNRQQEKVGKSLELVLHKI